jgi:hypothetical protein
MSPKEYIKMGAEKPDMGIEGYFMPILEQVPPSKMYKPGFSIGK